MTYLKISNNRNNYAQHKFILYVKHYLTTPNIVISFLSYKISSLRPFSTYLTGDCAFESLILSNYWIFNELVNEQKRSHFLPEGIIYGPFLNPFKNGFARDSQHVFI